MYLYRRPRTVARTARHLLTAVLLPVFIGAAAGAVAQSAETKAFVGQDVDRRIAAPPILRFDLEAAPRAVLSGDGLAPILPQAGFSLGAGMELRTVSWIPVRVGLEYFHVFPSAVSSAGDLYRSWAGWDLSLASGVSLVSREGGAPLGVDLLGGVSFGAARYPGTTVVFATFSADLMVRADFSKPGAAGWRAVLPLSYIFRPGARSFSAGLGAAYILPPLRSSGGGASGGGG